MGKDEGYSPHEPLRGIVNELKAIGVNQTAFMEAIKEVNKAFMEETKEENTKFLSNIDNKIRAVANEVFTDRLKEMPCRIQDENIITLKTNIGEAFDEIRSINERLPISGRMYKGRWILSMIVGVIIGITCVVAYYNYLK
jgi:hypothetical protein